MAKKLLFLPVLVLSLLIISFEARANVGVEDSDSNNVTGGSFTSATVPTGLGQDGDYQLIACGVFTDNGNTFSAPTPGTWNELDNGICDDPDGNCFQGIWGRFTNNPASEDITCTWNISTSNFVAGSFRYNQVDPVDPIIAVACNSAFEAGQNIIATAPSIETIAGSQVVRIYTYRNFNVGETSGNTNSNTDTTGTYESISAPGTSESTVQRGDTELFLVDGPTGTASIDAGFDAEWRACTIALRMVNIERAVPTMSEWGLIGFAAFAGIAGVWYLRRRQATA